ETLFGKGGTDEADLTLSTDIDTARQVFVAGDQQAGMQAFMSGKVRVQGDMTKLMMQGASGGNAALSAALQEITEEALLRLPRNEARGTRRQLLDRPALTLLDRLCRLPRLRALHLAALH